MSEIPGENLADWQTSDDMSEILRKRVEDWSGGMEFPKTFAEHLARLERNRIDVSTLDIEKEYRAFLRMQEQENSRKQ